MTQPIHPKQSTRLSQISFFHICNWIMTHKAEVTPGKTHTELCQLINETEELETHTPSGGLGVHSIPAIIRATGYVSAAPGSRSKTERTKITKTKFNELKRDVAKLREEVAAVKESQGRLVTIVQEVREIPPEDEPRSTDGDPAMRDHAEVDKVKEEFIDSRPLRTSPIIPDESLDKLRDDNDAQLDDVHPEEAPHQEKPKKRLPGGTYVGPYKDEDETVENSVKVPEHPNQMHIPGTLESHDEKPSYGTLSTEGSTPEDDETFEMFQKSTNFEPSPEIQALIDAGNAEANQDKEESTHLPE